MAFYSDAADGLEAQLRDLKRADRFIFMEYHAVLRGGRGLLRLFAPLL